MKAANKDFRSVTFIPKLARDRKAKVDKLLMAFKKEEDDFRYLVRNGEEDKEVLMTILELHQSIFFNLILL